MALRPGHIDGEKGTARENEADRVRQVRAEEPIIARRRRTGEFHVSGIHAQLRDQQGREIHHLETYGTESPGGEAAASQADASSAHARTGAEGGRMARTGAQWVLPISRGAR